MGQTKRRNIKFSHDGETLTIQIPSLGKNREEHNRLAALMRKWLPILEKFNRGLDRHLGNDTKINWD